MNSTIRPMEFSLVARMVSGCPQIFATKQMPTALWVDFVPEEGRPDSAQAVRYCSVEIEKLARAGIAFDPAEAHHRVMIDKWLMEQKLPPLTGSEWSAIRKHYRSLKRSRK